MRSIAMNARRISSVRVEIVGRRRVRAARATHGPALRRSAGFTLVELMVAMVIGLIISIAAVAALVVARTGFTSVDTTAQLRENGRFASDLMQRVIVQAGFEDDSQRNGNRMLATRNNEDPEPDVVGYNNAAFPLSPGLPPVVLNDSRNTACGSVSDSSCANGSDVLIVRYQGMNLPGTPTADGSMINCAGIPEPAVTESTDSRAYSVFHVERAPQSGEPVLMCSYRDASGAWAKQALIQGVESFQVLYGTDSVTINAAPPAAAVPPAVAASAPDSIPDRYLRADQIIVPGNAIATRANWRRVRSIRVGLVLRGPVNSKSDRSSTTDTFYPFGLKPTASGAPAPNTDVIVSSTADVGTALAVPQDGRLRLDGLNFTVYLRNRLLND
jgi:type IV pilus assembly protein PilW